MRPAAPAVVVAEPAPNPPSLGVQLYRFFFYGWLFRDADAGSALERSIAMRHNVAQAKWLPVYLLRWLVLGALLATLEAGSEYLTGNSPLSAALALGLVFVALYLLVTSICWAFLQARRQRP